MTNYSRSVKDDKISLTDYQKQLEELIENEVHAELTVSQATQRAQLWAQVQQLWNERGKENDVEQESSQEDEQRKIIHNDTTHNTALRPYTECINQVIQTDLPTMRKDASSYRYWYNIMQSVVIIASILAATIVNIEGLPRWITAIFSGIISIASGFIVAFKYKDRSFNLQQTADTIEYEHHLFKLKHDDYDIDDVEKRHKLFTKRITRIQNEQRQREQILEQSTTQTQNSGGSSN